MSRRKACCVHTVGAHLGNEERDGGRGRGEPRRPERAAADGPPRSCRLLSTAPVPKGRPTKMTHNEPKEPTYDPFSSIPKSPPRQKSFPPRAPGGLPGGRGAQAPGAAQPPELQEVGRTSVTALQGSDAGVPGPRSGVEINTAPAARRRCRRCPAGPRGQPCCSASCRPLPTHGRSPQRAVREEQRPLFCHGQHQARPQVPWAARVPSRSLPATGSREEISRGSAGHI